MIINFSVSNFRSIRDEVTLSFEASRSDDMEKHYVINTVKNLRLLKLGIIYGPNASGKTNLLEALEFLRSITTKPIGTKTGEFDFEPFLFDDVSRVQNTVFSLEFVSNQVKYLYRVELNRKCVVTESLDYFMPNSAKVFSRTTDQTKQLVDIEFGSKIRIPADSRKALAGNTLWNNTVIGGYLKTNIDSRELQDVAEWFKSFLKPIIKPDSNLVPFIFSRFESDETGRETQLKILRKAGFDISDLKYKRDQLEVNEELLNYLNRDIPIPAEEIEKIRNRGMVDIQNLLVQHTVNGREHLLSLESESRGTKRYIELGGVLAALLRGDVVISIDELESSMHPDLVKHFLLTFLMNSGNSQLIATTHMRELLLEKEILRNDVIWFMEQKEDASSDLFCLNDFDTSVVRKSSSIYNAYKIGRLGAVPDLGDYYLGIADE